MGAGSGALGFGGGFAKGFANGLLRKHQEERDKQIRADEAKAREGAMLFPTILQMGIDSGDLGRAEEMFAHYYPDAAKEFKKQGGLTGSLEHIAPFLRGQSHTAAAPAGVQPAAAGPTATPDQTAMQGEQDAALTQSGQPPALPSRQLVDPQTPPKPGPTFFGTPVTTPEQLAARKANEHGALTQAEIQAKVDAAKKLVALGVDKTMDTALERVGLGTYAQRRAATGSLPQAGTFGDQLLRKQNELGRALTSDEVATEKKAWDKLNDQERSLGVYAERAARDLGFKSAEDAAQQGKMGDVNKRAAELAAEQTTATTTARTNVETKAPLTQKQKLDALLSLQDDWRKADAPSKEMARQFALMQTGLKRFNEGDKNGGSQAVLVTFQKILDPNSVVRESEYARSGQGLGLLNRMEGYVERLQNGGAGVPKEELAAMVETARQFIEGTQAANDLERDRITGTAKDNGINPDRIFGVKPGAKAKDTGTTDAAPAAGGGPTGVTIKNGKLYQNGKLLPGQ